MSTQDTNLAEALKMLQPTAEVILRSRPMDFTNETYDGFQPLLDDAMRQVLSAYVPGTNKFLTEMQMKSAWTLGMSRAVANILRQTLRGESDKPAKALWKCFDCKVDFTSWSDLDTHKRFCTGRPSGPARQAPSVPVLAQTFVPTHNIDLRNFPPGRFAVIDATGKVRFFVITELKKRATLTGRFVWSKFRTAREHLVAGDRTIREQIGDTKKYIGKQRLTESVYFGESEELIDIIAKDPAQALQLYGRQLKKCGYCGRSLTDAESLDRGIGPDCWETKHVPYIFAKAGITS